MGNSVDGIVQQSLTALNDTIKKADLKMQAAFKSVLIAFTQSIKNLLSGKVQLGEYKNWNATCLLFITVTSFFHYSLVISLFDKSLFGLTINFILNYLKFTLLSSNPHWFYVLPNIDCYTQSMRVVFHCFKFDMITSFLLESRKKSNYHNAQQVCIVY